MSHIRFIFQRRIRNFVNAFVFQRRIRNFVNAFGFQRRIQTLQMLLDFKEEYKSYKCFYIYISFSINTGLNKYFKIPE